MYSVSPTRWSPWRRRPAQSWRKWGGTAGGSTSTKCPWTSVGARWTGCYVRSVARRRQHRTGVASVFRFYRCDAPPSWDAEFRLPSDFSAGLWTPRRGGVTPDGLSLAPFGIWTAMHHLG